MPISEIEEVFVKYRKDEDFINTKLNQKTEAFKKESDYNIFQNKLTTSLAEAKERNRFILKNLETVKGNLRSKAIYSPSETQWKKIEESYRTEPSLGVNKWRCHLPVLV